MPMDLKSHVTVFGIFTKDSPEVSQESTPKIWTEKAGIHLVPYKESHDTANALTSLLQLH